MRMRPSGSLVFVRSIANEPIDPAIELEDVPGLADDVNLRPA